MQPGSDLRSLRRAQLARTLATQILMVRWLKILCFARLEAISALAIVMEIGAKLSSLLMRTSTHVVAAALTDPIQVLELLRTACT